MYNEAIRIGIAKKINTAIIARKIYLSYPTHVFKNKYDLEFELFDSISTHFNIPFKTIQVAGSSKTGFSYYKKKEFIEGASDLDIAIIDTNLFLYYSELVFKITKGFRDLSNFERTKDGESKFEFYSSSLIRGIFRPDFMPRCEEKNTWFNFFNKLSLKYLDLFADINAGIYLNEYYFEYKQTKNIDWFKNL